MPLTSGSSQETISSNISEMMNSSTFGAGKSSGKKHQMAIAAAMDKAGKSKKGKKSRRRRKGHKKSAKTLSNHAMSQ